MPAGPLYAVLAMRALDTSKAARAAEPKAPRAREAPARRAPQRRPDRQRVGAPDRFPRRVLTGLSAMTRARS